MLGLLKRHEVGILLKAGHKRAEVARLTGVSPSSIQRVAGEAPIEDFNDSAERRKRRIGRPSVVEGFRKIISDTLEKEADLPSFEILRQVRKAGYSGGKTVLYALVSSLRRIKPDTKRNEAFEWMRAVQQGAISRSALEKELGHVTKLDQLVNGMRSGPSPQRKKAMAVLSLERGIKCSLVRSFLHLSKRSTRSYWERYRHGSTVALFAKRMNPHRKSQDERIRQTVFALLHSPPSVHGINRTTWKLTDLQRILREHGQSISRDLIIAIIKDTGFKWRKARVVLTSRDPNYQAKVEMIVKILSELKSDEAFFSIDEFGPFAVKKRGGRKRVAPGEDYTVPQRQKSKGCLIITAALELSRNQVTHFYSDRKNTQEMIKIMDLLRIQYRNCTTIYLSWDAASWHVSQDFAMHVKQRNDEAFDEGYPVVKTAPLPVGAQFLNVIESVFSGMARAIIHNSDYCSVEVAKGAIDRYYAERNEYFRVHSKKAGHKIWGQERTESEFHESNNCKDPLYCW
ncbi:MAG TPA: IS630 family transposase [Terriglobales bacterium]|nr:IS630 family transposase [Terriglobales bacterium]